jgi:hypothetical protein
VRRYVLVALLFSSLVGAGAFAVGGAGGPTTATSSATALAGSELEDRHPSAAVAGAPDVLDAVVGERTERLGELARSEARSARHARPVDWAIAVAVVASAVAALTIALARRRPGRAAVRVGRVPPSRAPPLSLSFS